MTHSRKKILACSAALLGLLGAGLVWGWFSLENHLHKQISRLSRESSVINLKYSSLKINPLAGRVRLHDASMGYAGLGRIQAKTIDLSDFSFGPDYPRAMTAVFKDVDLHQTLQSSGFFARKDLKKARLGTGDIALKYRFSPDQSAGLEAFLTISGPDQGLLCVQTLLSGVEPDLVFARKNPFFTALALLGIKLDFLQAGYVDQGLIRRLSPMRELDEHPSGEAGKGPDLPGLKPSAANKNHNAIKNFFQHQAPLLIKSNPDNPVSLVELLKLESPESASSLLNLEISNSAPDFCLSMQQ